MTRPMLDLDAFEQLVDLGPWDVTTTDERHRMQWVPEFVACLKWIIATVKDQELEIRELESKLLEGED